MILNTALVSVDTIVKDSKSDCFFKMEGEMKEIGKRKNKATHHVTQRLFVDSTSQDLSGTKDGVQAGRQGDCWGRWDEKRESIRETFLKGFFHFLSVAAISTFVTARIQMPNCHYFCHRNLEKEEWRYRKSGLLRVYEVGFVAR